MAKQKKKANRVNKAAKTANIQNKKVTIEKREAKKAAVLGAEKKARRPLLVAIACVVIAAGGVFWYIQHDRVANTAVAVSSSAGTILSQVTFPVSLFEDGKARHFEHIDGNFTIRYFILKSSDGIIRAAFDACDVCWPAGKGYYQEGDYMVCRNCGRRFASVLVNEVKGGCNPAPLVRKVENGKLIIEVSDILEGKQYFKFSGKV